MFRLAPALLCFATVALIALGLTMLASTGIWAPTTKEPYFFLKRQIIMAAVGLAVAFVAAMIQPRFLRSWAGCSWLIACGMLVLCFVPGIGVGELGSNRWVKFPGVPQFQPSEFAKIIVVIAMAAWFARWQSEVRTFWRGFFLPGILAGVPVCLIAAETDVGSALSLSVAAGALLYCVGARLLFLIPTAVAVITAALYYITHNPNRWARIEAWLDLENPIHQTGFGMQQWRALLALGHGGPWGVGLGNGQEKFGTLTYAHIDFIFPVVGEELGLPFTLGVVLCYVLITVCGVSIAVQATNMFNRCLALGLTCVVSVPAIVNIAVTTAVLPNDGLPLPFVSYGGTSLVFSMIAVGLLVGIHRHSPAVQYHEFPLDREREVSDV